MRQVAGVDDLFNEKLRIVVEYMQFREFPSDLKRKVSRLDAPLGATALRLLWDRWGATSREGGEGERWTGWKRRESGGGGQ